MAEHFSFAEQVLHYFDRPHTSMPDGPLSGRSAWRGADLAHDRSWETTLGEGQIAEIDEAVRLARATGKELAALAAADFPLPTLHTEIARWREELDEGRGFLLVRGLPVDRWSGEETETAFWCLGQHLGRPGAQSGRNDLLGHVTDLGDPADADGRQYRTNQDIRFHCDAADVVGLLCLKTAKEGGASRLVSSVTVFNQLLAQRPEVVPRLFEPFLLDTREEREGGTPHVPIQPCCFDGTRLRTFMHVGYFSSVVRHGVELDDAAAAALSAWEEVAERPDIHLDMEFGPGDLQLVSNHTVTHARTAYVDHDDPMDKRHLLRLWLSLISERQPAGSAS